MRSALPCHTESLGQGPLCGVALRTRSPSLRGDSAGEARMPLSASRTLPAMPNGRPAMTAPAANSSGIGREHHRGHRAARGKPGDEDPMLIDAVVGDHARDHLPDRGGLAAPARDVVRIEPVEAAIGVVRALLLRQQQAQSRSASPASTSRRRGRNRRRSGRSHAARRPARAAAAASRARRRTCAMSPGSIRNP